MKTKKLNFEYLVWSNDKKEFPEIFKKYDTFQFEAPKDLEFYKTINDWIFVYPYSLEVYELLKNQESENIYIYNINDKWIVGKLGRNSESIECKPKQKMIKKIDILENSDICVRFHLNENCYDYEKKGWNCTKNLKDIRIIGLKNNKFKVMSNNYYEEDDISEVEISYIFIPDFFNFIERSNKHSNSSEWITLDEFNNRLQKTFEHLTNK